jgi:glycine cleavage system H lipoate-binding protein
MHAAKAVEYLIAIAFLFLFIPFWRFVSAQPAARESVLAAVRRPLDQLAGWFVLPDNVYFHPGHAWARFGDSQLVTVGLDDFAQKLVGDLSGVSLPKLGSRVEQGERGWSLIPGATSIDMLSPVDGTVVAVNEQVMASPDVVRRDPYGDGWLFKVRAARPRANLNQLLSGTLAKHWMEEATDAIQGMIGPEVGRVLQDGGVPVHGIARSLNAEKWDELCRRFFLTEVQDARAKTL